MPHPSPRPYKDLSPNCEGEKQQSAHIFGIPPIVKQFPQNAPDYPENTVGKEKNLGKNRIPAPVQPKFRPIYTE
jgi:hypothetical protein